MDYDIKYQTYAVNAKNKWLHFLQIFIDINKLEGGMLAEKFEHQIIIQIIDIVDWKKNVAQSINFFFLKPHLFVNKTNITAIPFHCA